MVIESGPQKELFIWVLRTQDEPLQHLSPQIVASHTAEMAEVVVSSAVVLKSCVVVEASVGASVAVVTVAVVSVVIVDAVLVVPGGAVV